MRPPAVPHALSPTTILCCGAIPRSEFLTAQQLNIITIFTSLPSAFELFGLDAMVNYAVHADSLLSRRTK
jgi:hypothetical protein